MSSRLHSHSPLPAPAMRASVTTQSKSHVLAGVQDAYWSDDEADDADCPLCLEEMDISDLNFKPCPCGYQICRFCWHHIKENLNSRCPACRREYTDEAVQFKPVNKEDHKRLTQQKKQRERERKELDALNRRHLANVRVVQRNVVYVVGMGPRFAKEELIPTLRSNEYFGQYGKISKILITKRTPPGGRAPLIGLYITYHRREDAARCIQAVDGAPSPGGGGEIMRASYGTTKYCMTFLRGVSCPDHSCMNLHEWGDESDCFTKEDLTTLKHTMKDTETRTRTVTSKGDEDAGLPRAASWANKGFNSVANTALHNHTNTSHPLPSASRLTSRRTTTATGTRASRSGSTAGASESRPTARERKTAAASSTVKTPSSSRPATPSSARPTTPAGTRSTKHKEPVTIPPVPSRSPVSTAADSDIPSPSPSLSPTEPIVPAVKEEVVAPTPALPPGIPAVPPGLASPAIMTSPPVTAPPGLSAPPGLPPPTRQLGVSPPVASSSSQGSYQMSTQALALVEDIKARRESALISPAGQSPFPDFDRMLQNLSGGDNGFSFNLDPKLAGDDADAGLTLPDIDTEPAPFSGSYLDAFPNLRIQSSVPPFVASPVLAQARPGYGSAGPGSPVVERQSTGSSYTGSFNPFSENAEDGPSRRFSPLDEERKMSRFGFARGRQGSSSSPLHTASPLGHHSESANHTPFFNTPDIGFAQANTSWNGRPPLADYMHSSTSAMSSPLVQHAQAHTQSVNYNQSPQLQQQPTPSGRFQPFDTSVSVSEAQLREFISASRNGLNGVRSASTDPHGYKFSGHQAFNDPAIMSAQMVTSPMLNQQSNVRDNGFASPQSSMDNITPQHMNYGPPPGIMYPPGIIPGPMMAGRHQGQPLSGGVGVGIGVGLDASQASASAHVSNPTSPTLPSTPSAHATTIPPSPVLSSADFPALQVATTASTGPTIADSSSNNNSNASQDQVQPSQPQADNADVTDAATPDANTPPAMTEKELEKAERRAARKAAAAERAAERQRIAQEKAAARAVEKERIATEKAAEKERLAKEKEEKDRVAKEKAEKDRVVREAAEKERLARLEKEKAERERVAKEKAQKEAKKAQEVKQKAAAAAQKSKQTAPSTPSIPTPQVAKAKAAKQAPAPSSPAPLDSVTQAPILARMPKKNKPVTKPIKIPKVDPVQDAQSNIGSAGTSETPPQLPEARTADSSSTNSRAHSVEPRPIMLEELLCDMDMANPWMNVPRHVYFDLNKINPAAKMPLEYGPLVHALSALSVGGGSFANNMPSGSIDNAVSSFQQLLETLTQTISDLLRLLPRTTWDDSSSFDGVLRDMLKGDDFLDDGGDDQNGHGKEDEVAALTMALERRARWMEVQLSKLEELHRDINTAAVRAVLSFNDNGWFHNGVIPKNGHSLQRFDEMGFVQEDGELRPMTGDELEKELLAAKEAAIFAEADLREAMQVMIDERPLAEDEW
ncbi:transcriptional repressor proteinral negative regulator of transcription subunit 4 [Steccherinum ochraceum]|uniref:Transcriptional repressor proteinral negative regulator of transcription subunit 4 n=1 Tax=Steccherinum ochraceum TaxID=92696 RepID=A0A4R0RPF3_9APHY|nr:transcriptional repressor proteinral negative regulator of transcription subunit 4 [Steccherinum ochraceum]